VRGRFLFQAQGAAAVMRVPETAVPSKPEIDVKIRRLVDALNAFDGIATLGSCGGHPKPLKGGQWPDGSWYVTLTVRRDTHGWRALEFLAWLINHHYARAEAGVMFYPDALPPYMNTPGSMLKFALEGYQGTSPDKLASFMNQQREACFIPVARHTNKSTHAAHTSVRSAGTARKR
jgi:hypothetical protein